MLSSSQKALYDRIQVFSLDEGNAKYSYTQRLMDENNWSVDYTKRVIEEYKKFIFLAVISVLLIIILFLYPTDQATATNIIKARISLENLVKVHFWSSIVGNWISAIVARILYRNPVQRRQKNHHSIPAGMMFTISALGIWLIITTFRLNRFYPQVIISTPRPSH